MELMTKMVESGEIDALVQERVWSELVKALSERSPTEFFRVLRECGALPVLLPEIERLFGIPQPEKHHPEIDTGVHTLMVLEQAAKLTDDVKVRFAALTHDLGKALTPKENWPHHYNHEELGQPALENLCQRLRVPGNYARLARQVMRYHGRCHRVFEIRASTLVDTLQSLNAFRKDTTLQPFVLACEADARGRTGFESREYPQADFFLEAQSAALSVQAAPLIEQGLENEAIGQKLREMRISEVKACKTRFMVKHQLSG